LRWGVTPVQVPDDIRQSYQRQLEKIVPVSTAKSATDVLIREFKNLEYKRTPQDQQAIQDAFTWHTARQRSE
jgi:hypothetical protein